MYPLCRNSGMHLPSPWLGSRLRQRRCRQGPHPSNVTFWRKVTFGECRATAWYSLDCYRKPTIISTFRPGHVDQTVLHGSAESLAARIEGSRII